MDPDQWMQLIVIPRTLLIFGVYGGKGLIHYKGWSQYILNSAEEGGITESELTASLTVEYIIYLVVGLEK